MANCMLAVRLPFFSSNLVLLLLLLMFYMQKDSNPNVKNSMKQPKWKKDVDITTI